MHPPVDTAIYAECLKTLGRDWTLSYLSQAGQRGNRIWPYTRVAWSRITESSAAMAILNRHGVSLERPEPFHEGRNFMGSVDRMAA